jgi:ATP-dependent Lon protease
MLPSRNKKDLEDVPESAREQVNFVWLDGVDDAVEAALSDADEKSRRTEHFDPTEGRQAARPA